MKSRLNNQKGFTLVEIIAVLILLGILAAVAVPKYIDLTNNAEIRAIDAAVAELNGRENMAWANIKLSATGYGATSDNDVWTEVNTSLGDKYDTSAFVQATGGNIVFDNNTTINVVRTPSTVTSPGSWAIP